MKEIKNKLTILIKNILIAGSFLLLGFLIGCEDTYYEKEPFIMSWDARLPIDDNGYYHLEMNRNTWQTTHRISGVVSDENVIPSSHCKHSPYSLMIIWKFGTNA